MNNIVKSEIAVASQGHRAVGQRAAQSCDELIAVGGKAKEMVFAAVNASSTISAVIAALVGLTAVLFAPAAYAIRNEKN